MKAKRKPKKAVFNTNLRLPVDLASQVKERAQENGRSMNSQIVQELKAISAFAV